MALDPTVVLLLLVVLAVGVFAVVAFFRHRVAARIAFRNVRRGRTRTLLVILGLLVGTTIISGSLIIGDTVSAVNVHFVYQTYGYTTLGIYNQTPGEPYVAFPQGISAALSAATANDSEIRGLTPEIVFGTSSFIDLTTGIPQTNVNLIGVNASAASVLGSFTTTSGSTIAGPTTGGVLLDVQAANSVNATVGDHVRVFGPTKVVLTLQGIVNDDTRGGFLGGQSLFIDLPTAQTVQQLPGKINFIAVTNAGDLTSTASLTDSVTNTLNSALQQVGAPPGLTVHPLLQSALTMAMQSGNSLLTIFLALGLFSIAAGAMLIVGIFVMLADERKGEMGMLRAIGLKRRDLVYAFFFEGLVYSIGSALLGTLLGIGVAYVIVYSFAQSLSSAQVSASSILGAFTVTSTTLIIGYVSGFLLTLGTISIASGRASRLNIVRAIRSMPEPTPTIRLYSRLAYVGIALAALGGLLFATTYQGSTDISFPTLGGAMIILGGMLVATRFVRNRIAFSVGGFLLLLWAGSTAIRQAVLGTQHTGTIFIIFVEGIILVLGAVMLYVFNASTVLRGITAAVSPSPRAIPVTRIGLSYPARRPFRTAVNLTIFTLVIFTVVAVASFGSSLQSSIDNTILVESGGYTFVGFSPSPIPDLPGQIAANSTLEPLYSEVVPVYAGGGYLSWSGLSGNYADMVQTAPTGAPPPNNFYTTNQFNFSVTLNGLSTAQVWSRLMTDPNAAVVDGLYNGAGTQFSPTGHPTLTVGTVVTIVNGTGVAAHVTIIGIMSQTAILGIWVNPSVGAGLGISQPNLFFMTIAPGVSDTHAEQVTKMAFFSQGLTLINLPQAIRNSIQNTVAIVGLLEAFVALGLAVGIAAMGIVALRAVVERRAEIGMLRATGFRRRGILGVFLIEYSYVSLLGIAMGVALGTLLLYNAASGATNLGITFSVPWLNIVEVVLLAYALTVAATIGPSIRAARLPPAVAIRYSE